MKADIRSEILASLLNYEASRFISGEEQLKNSLHGWIEMAGSSDIKSLLLRYLNITQQHILKLKVFHGQDDLIPLSLSNGLMRSFVEEAEDRLMTCACFDGRDVTLLLCIQAINQFKMTAYEGASMLAEGLDRSRAATLFGELIVNEQHIQGNLSHLLRSEISDRNQVAREFSI